MESSVISCEVNHASDKRKTCKEEEEEEELLVSPKTLERIEEMITTGLPEANFFQPLRQYQGFWCFPVFLRGAILAQENFRAKPEDIFLCSAPKTGTTWLKALSFATVTRTHFDDSESPLLRKLPHDCIPYLEHVSIKNSTRELPPNLPLLSTHAPYSWLPNSITESGCKIVYICRNPKDVFVSLWHFVRNIESENREVISLEEGFDLYCRGTSVYGPYLDHVLGYWKASLEFPDRVLFLKYEEMMEDPAFYLKKLAEFMGYPFSLEEENEGEVQKIIDLCSFDKLSSLEINTKGKVYYDQGAMFNNHTLFRKGKVGDWKNYLTSEMAERLDKIAEDKLGKSGLKF
ncbi:Sulfotransferase [Melia azedarach]|uniref:Sulfotransferase n=1 Tax=Melia azedarach TaxID=155640 RepID=A0ACC1X429_MELAZ|nr:Sulfotransferase [Melia azedarach]